MLRVAENTVKDLFCGAGGSSTGAEMGGGEVVFALNHSPLAINVHNTNHPNTDHLLVDVQSMTDEQIRRTPDSAILIAGAECFTAGAMILTKRGLLPIEEVSTGDLVFTHRGRWRRVTATMSRTADTVIVRGEGHARLETTAEHPFLCRDRFDEWNNRERRYERSFGEPDWVPAGRMRGAYWCSVTDFGEVLEVPRVPGRALEFGEDFWWMVGRWLGDGLLRIEDIPSRKAVRARVPYRAWPAQCLVCAEPARRHARYPHLALAACSDACKRRKDNQNRARTAEVQITCGSHEDEELLRRLNYAPPGTAPAGDNELRWRRRDTRTGVVFATFHTGFALWLREHFGKGAAGKTIPTWALTMPRAWRTALLAGYVSADGHNNGRTIQATSVSRRLAVGVRLLALSLGLKASLNSPVRNPNNAIEGRRVNARPAYTVQWTISPDPSKERTLAEGRWRWSLVKDVEPGRRSAEVFNISVEEDESYVVDGMVVHNCTNHTLAKGAATRKQQAQPLFDENGVPTDSVEGAPLADGVEERSRATMDEVCRFIEQKAIKGRPYLAIVLENVTESYSWGQDNDGRYFKKWLNRILKVGYEHEILWLNSMLLPPEPGVPLVPQSRDRMYVVFWKKGIRRPDLSIRPPCWCVRCEKVVGGLQVFKRPDRPTRVAYGPQYYYVCPECHTTAVPAAAPAASIIDYATPITRIGERERPLKPATRERIRRGLRRLATEPFAIRLKTGREPAPLTIPLVSEPHPPAPTMTFPVSGTTYETAPGNRAKDASSSPLATIAATGERGMVMANHQHAVPKDAASHATQTVRTEGGLSLVTRTGHKSANGTLARDAEADPTFGITSAGDLALVLANRIHGVPKDARIHPAQTVCTGETLGVVELQQNGGVRRPSAPAHTVRGGGTHHGLLVSNYSPGWVRRAGELPFGSVTTTDGHALVVPYSTKGMPSVAGREPAPTVTTVERLSLVVPPHLPAGTVLPDPGPIGEDAIDSCFFRMFTVPELARAMAMAFRADGTPFLLEGTRADRIRLLGNAINPPVMRLIVSRLLAAIDSTPAGGLPDAA